MLLDLKVRLNIAAHDFLQNILASKICRSHSKNGMVFRYVTLFDLENVNSNPTKKSQLHFPQAYPKPVGAISQM